LGKNDWLLAGSFRPNGTSAVDNSLNSSIKGDGARCGFTVARTDVGLFTITFQDNATFASLVFQVTGAVPLVAIPVARNVVAGSAPTMTIQLYDMAGAVADLASATNNSVRFFGMFFGGAYRGLR